MARLDRLRPVKEVAQIGAAHRARVQLRAARRRRADATTPSCRRRSASSSASELVFQRGAPPRPPTRSSTPWCRTPPTSRCSRARASSSTLKIAKTLEQRFPETVEAEPELVAHHYTEAAMAEPAIAYWRRAGESAAQQSASAEAVAHINRGLELVRNLPETSARAEQELVLLNTLAAPLMNTKGYAAPEAVEVYDRAHDSL